jgi:hypothetical protein
MVSPFVTVWREGVATFLVGAALEGVVFFWTTVDVGEVRLASFSKDLRASDGVITGFGVEPSGRHNDGCFLIAIKVDEGPNLEESVHRQTALAQPSARLVQRSHAMLLARLLEDTRVLGDRRGVQ